MLHHRGMLVSLGLALVSAIVPVLLLIAVAWQISVEEDRDDLRSLVSIMLKRVDQAIDQSTSTLRSLTAAEQTDDLAACSRDHIQRMRQFTANIPPLDEIGYIHGNRVVCSSWGVPPDAIHTSPRVDRTTADGTQVTLKVRPAFSQGNPALSVRYGNYNTMVSLAHFTDLVVEPGVEIGLATTQGEILATSSDDPRLLTLLTQPGSPEPPGTWVASTEDAQVRAVALQPARGLFTYIHNQADTLLPAAALLGLFVFLLTLRLSAKQVSLRADLQIAISRRELCVHYQPIMDLRTGQCVGAEALLRWFRRDGTQVRPDRFIPVAEESGLIRAITDQLIQMVGRDLGATLARDPHLHISLNLSADDARSGRAMAVVERRLIQQQIRPAQIWLEVTERGFMDVDSARATLSRVREEGYLIAIDDFGTGYSSLQYLQSLPVDVLKIDKAFVGSVGTGAVSSHVIGHIIDMAKSLKLSLVAEGVETIEQVDFLRQHGVDYAQGWYYAKAMPTAEFLAFYHAHRVATPGA